jgi:hypothetical protein
VNSISLRSHPDALMAFWATGNSSSISLRSSTSVFDWANETIATSRISSTP